MNKLYFINVFSYFCNKYNTISEKEQEEIILITDFIEEKSAERVTLLAVLAKIRKISITDLVKQLDLKNYH